MDFVVELEHSPDLCPHSNATARKQFDSLPEFNLMAKKLGIETIFAGIAVPEHKTFMVLKGPISNRSGVCSFKAGLCRQTMLEYA
jgi:hypothetical protein